MAQINITKMKEKWILFILTFSIILNGFSQEAETPLRTDPEDSIKVYYLDQMVVNSSVKETNLVKNIPSSVSVLSPQQISDSRIESLTELSGQIPNFFIPSYGSKVSTPVYIRGIGARNGPQTVSVYVDNVPRFNTSAYDFEFQDIQQIEVLRGAQGTLYGRNAIGGIVNIYTLSPLKHQGVKAEIGAGNYGQFTAKAASYNKLSKNVGLSLTGFYKKDKGYFTNDLTGESADNSESTGARLKLEWLIAPRLSAKIFSHYGHISQNAFPYMNVETSRIENNAPAFYEQDLFSNGLSLRYFGTGYSINYTAGYQYLNDNMKVDQDFSPQSIFTLDQFQKERAISHELTVKSENKSSYQWVVGTFGFYNRNIIEAPVTIQKDGMAILQAQLDRIGMGNPAVPEINYLHNQIDFPGIYEKPAKGLALFHQSTIHDLFGVDKLSATGGIRLDYENTGIDLDARSQGADVSIRLKQGPPGMPPFIVDGDTSFLESYSKDYLQFLPKLAVSYKVSDETALYLSASKGYKSGGYNEQAFYKILQSSLMESLMRNAFSGMPGPGGPGGPPPSGAPEPTLEEQMSYDPELSWTYELGGRSELFDRKVSATFALYYMNVDNIQITRIVDQQGTVGRSVTNAGQSESKGAELGIRYNPDPSFTLFGEYGFADTRLVNYTEGELDYSGNYIPFAPQNTMSLGASYVYRLNDGSFLDQIGANLQYAGAGRMYWTEANDIYQPFYGLVNGSLSFKKGAFGLEIWGKNIFDTQYNAFHFRSTSMRGVESSYVQKGIPTRIGVSVKYDLEK